MVADSTDSMSEGLCAVLVPGTESRVGPVGSRVLEEAAGGLPGLVALVAQPPWEWSVGVVLVTAKEEAGEAAEVMVVRGKVEERL
eukprot:g1151.t1